MVRAGHVCAAGVAARVDNREDLSSLVVAVFGDGIRTGLKAPTSDSRDVTPRSRRAGSVVRFVMGAGGKIAHAFSNR